MKTRLGLGEKALIHASRPFLSAWPDRPVSYTQLADLRPHLDGLAEQFDIGSTFNEGAAQCADGLIAHKEDGTLRPPEVVLEMVADAAGLAHAAGREDDLRLPIGVDHPGFVAGHADPQAGALDGVDALGQQGAGRLVKTVGVGILSLIPI